MENVFEINSVLGFNLYSYSENNPVTYKIKNENTEYTSAIESNYLYNKKISENVTGYIYDQEAEPVSKLRYGLNTTYRDGCGWVATYNALMMLGNRMEPYEVIHEYEKHGVLFYGLFGTHPAAIVRFFKVRGYDVKVTYDSSEFGIAAQDSAANIMFYTHKYGGHYISFKNDDSGCWGYNLQTNNPFGENLSGNIAQYMGVSVSDFLSNKKYNGRILISISPKERAENPDESNENLQE